MVFRHISADMKARALELLCDGWDIGDVVDALGMSQRSVERWQTNWELFGEATPKTTKRGRPRILDQVMLANLRELIREHPDLYLDEIGQWLAIYEDVEISTSALHDSLEDMGITHKLMKRIAPGRDDVERTYWMNAVYERYSAEQLVFLDESSKDGRTLARHYGRAPTGERAVAVQPLARGDRFSILPALSVDGYIACRVVRGSVDSTELVDFVLNDVASPHASFGHVPTFSHVSSCQE